VFVADERVCCEARFAVRESLKRTISTSNMSVTGLENDGSRSSSLLWYGFGIKRLALCVVLVSGYVCCNTVKV